MSEENNKQRSGSKKKMETCELAVKTQKRLADEIGITVVKLHREQDDIGMQPGVCTANSQYCKPPNSRYFFLFYSKSYKRTFFFTSSLEVRFIEPTTVFAEQIQTVIICRIRTIRTSQGEKDPFFHSCLLYTSPSPRDS